MINKSLILGIISILCYIAIPKVKCNGKSLQYIQNTDDMSFAINNNEDSNDKEYKSKFDNNEINQGGGRQRGQNNFILIIADDMGIELLEMYKDELGEYARDFYPYTPVLDSLAADGIKFTRAYSYPLCSPTRVTLLTGRYGFRTSMTYPISANNCPVGLEFPQPTIPLSLPTTTRKAAIGKWHMDSQDQDSPSIDHPFEAGFERYDGLLAGGILASTDSLGYVDWSRCNNENPDCFDEPGYFTSVVTDAAIEWIQGLQGEQFFLWLAHVAPHTPIHTPPLDLITNVPQYECSDELPPEEAVYCAMAAIEAMDTEIGRLLDSLDEEVRSKTTILFLGDNGSGSSFSDSQPYPDDEVKGTVHEGGIRVPFIISGNAVNSKGRTSDALVSTVDIFSTVLSTLGGSPNEDVTIDSTSLFPIMKIIGNRVNDFVHSELKRPPSACSDPTAYIDMYPNADAIIGEIYKLMTYTIFVDGDEQEIDYEKFYDLSQDPFERNDLLANGEGGLSETELENLNILRETRVELFNS